jgi:hypothetical protein
VNSDFVKPITQLLDLALRIPTQWWASLCVVTTPLHRSSYFLRFKTITGYKYCGHTPGENVIGHYKIYLEAFKSYEIVKQ